MKAVGIVAGGDVSLLPSDLNYIACDRGYDAIMKQGKQPIILIGDLDSTTHQSFICPVIRLNPQKDQTDLEEAIQYAIKEGYETIHVYGATGGRLDHFYSALVLLQRFYPVVVWIHDDKNCIRLIQDESIWIQNSNQYISVFPIVDSLISMSGFLYPLDEAFISPSNPLITSNELIDHQGMIQIKGKALLFECKR